MKGFRVSHYRDRCIGCGTCVNLAPENWEMDDIDGKANLIGASFTRQCFNTVLPPLFHEENIRAAEQCPVNIIHIHE